MWQARLPFLACLCWLLMTESLACNDDTVYTKIGLQSVLLCPLSSVINNIQWIGPPGDIPYNLEGTTILNVDELPADFVSRLAIHPTTGALIINNTQKSDENCYTCKRFLELISVKLSIMVSPQPPFIDNTLEDNGFGRTVLWAMEESQIRLVCQIKGGNPRPSVKWIRGGVPSSEVAANNSVQNNTNGTYDVTSTITVMAYRSEDREKYFCQANHTTWTSPQNASVELYLYLTPRNPVLSEKVSLQEGENLSARCSVTGCRPAANLTWTGLQGQQIQTSTWISDDETYNVTSLYTIVVSRQDNGVKLLCSVTHTTLRSSLNASTTLAVWFPPTSVSINNNRNVTAGRDTLTLICTTGTSNPIADITWSNGTSPATGNLSSKTELPGVYGGKILSQNLTITPTRYMDGSTIMCSAQNSMTSAQSVNASIILSVMYNPVSVISNGPSLFVKEGDTNLALVCVAESKPVSSFMWVKDTVTLNTTGPKSDNRDTYIISQVDRTHYGEYSCIANNNISPSGQGNVSLHVMFPPTNVSITNNRNVTAGSDILILTCTTGTSNPIANITWRNGTNVPTGELSIKTELSGAYGGKVQYQNLTITPTRYMDGSIIACLAQSSHTTGPSISDRVTLNIRYSPIVQVSITPNVIVTEGDSLVTIQCSASSKPISKFTVTKEGLTTVVSEGIGTPYNRHDYIIKWVSRTDAGRYSCTANNSVVGPQNESSAIAELVVQYPPDITLSASNVTTNDTLARLVCMPHGIPSRYTFDSWQHLWPGYNQTLRTLQSTSSDEHSVTLDLDSLSYQDSGIYVCQAGNGIKTAEMQNNFKRGGVFVLVKAPPVILKIPKQVGGAIGRFITIQLEYYSYNDAGLVTLQHSNSSQLYQTETVDEIHIDQFQVQNHYVPAKGFRGNFNISIKDGDFGNYTVNVSNSIGFNFTTLEIIPEDVPRKPQNFNYSNPQKTQISLSWNPGFHGGFNQTFVIQISLDKILWSNASFIPGGMVEEKELFSTTITELRPDTIYYFRIYAFNLKGDGAFADEVITVNTLADQKETRTDGPQITAIVGGVAGGGVAGLALVVVLVLFFRRRTSSSEKNMNSELLQRERPDIGLKDNPVYDSSGPLPGPSAGSAGTEYAVVSKPKKTATQLDDPSNVYAQVDKKNKKQTKELVKVKQGKRSRGDIYENADLTQKNTNLDQLYENSGHVGAQASGKNVYEDPGKPKVIGPLVNKDGLMYADLMLDSPTTVNGKPVIRGIENRTEYAHIAYGKKGDLLPDSDDEQQMKH